VSGSEFQTDFTATENARRAMSVLVLGTVNRGARDNRRCLAGIATLVEDKLFFYGAVRNS